MKKFIIGALMLLLSGSVVSAGGLNLARDGNPNYAIVQGRAPSEAESFAAKELADYLQKVTGAAFPVVTEGDKMPLSHGIYVGWTDFASGQGINLSALDKEEWILRAAGDNLILTGGRPRGTLYAVYEFLESEVGCLWLDRDTEVVPSKPNLTVDQPDIRSKPAFWWRSFYSGFFSSKPKADKRAREQMFRLRNKGNAEDAGVNRAQFGFEETFGSPKASHTFFSYVDPKIWFEKHPEYFMDDGTGKRTAGNMEKPGVSGSSLCVTNPDVRRIVVEQLRKFIEKDREAAQRSNRPPPVVYNISQEDNAAHMCRCPKCKVIIEREGSESGPIVEFINCIADEIREEYPDIFIQTSAYVSTEQPPKTLTVRDNVIIIWADLYSKSESARPLTHPLNRGQAEMVRGWGKIAKNIFVWDYWGHGAVAPPDTNVHTIQPDMQFFHENNVTGIFIEAEEHLGQSFYALVRWLAYKMMQNPYQPDKPLIDKFLNGYYGPAAPKVREWLSYIQARIAANPDKIISSFPSQNSRRHWDLDFFVTGDRLLQAAIDACPPESPYRMHAQKELVTVLRRITERLSALESEAAEKGQPCPFKRKETVDRYEAVAKASGLFFGPAMIAQLDILRDPPPLPAPLKDVRADQITEFFWPDFLHYENELVDDPDAAAGRALRLITGILPYSMGVYDKTNKVAGPRLILNEENIPQDEKYHLYKIGRFRVAPGTYVWTNPSWCLGTYIDRAYRQADGADPAVNDWVIYVSLKLTGPRYVEGSTEKNAAWMDRVILVQPLDGTPESK